MFNLRQLKTFIAVAEERSFTKAAKALYMTQPAISAQIKAMEERLEVQLIERNDKNVVLTEAGEILYKDSHKILSIYEGFIEAIDELKGLRRGKLSIAASTTPGEYVLPRLLGGFNKEFPEVKLSLKVYDTACVIDEILNRTTDIGMIGANVNNPALHVEEFLKDELILIGSPELTGDKTQISIEEIIDLKLVLREKGSGTRMVLSNQLKKHGINIDLLHVIMELGSTRAIISAVESGLGFSFVSRFAAKEALQLGKIKEIKIKGELFYRCLYLIWNENKYQSFALKEFLKFLKAQKDSVIL